MFGIGVLCHEIVVLVLCVAGTFHLQFLKRIDHLLVFRLQDKPVEILLLLVARIVLEGVLAGYLAAQIIITQIRSEVVIQLCAL